MHRKKKFTVLFFYCNTFFLYFCRELEVYRLFAVMNNDFSQYGEGQAERTVKPESTRERVLNIEEASENVNAGAVQQTRTLNAQAMGKKCPYCGAINDPEAMFCEQCGQPISKTACPYCGAELDPDADFCEQCHHYIRKDVCSFCGAHLTEGAGYCPECGSPRGGLVCPTCHSLNDFAFCKKCGTPLTEEARKLFKEMQKNPDYQELLQIVQDYAKLENALPYNSERDIIREQAGQKIRERVLMLLAKDEGVPNPVIPEVKSKRMTKEELEEQKAVKMKMLSAILDNMAIPKMESPVKARNFAMAAKPAGVRLAWVCNFKHAMHSSPCGCAKPQLGGKWVVLGKNSTDEIKDDK